MYNSNIANGRKGDSFMTVVLGKILSVFLIIAVGFGANRLGVLPSEANKYMSNILMFITSPCLILSSITAKELTRETAVATVELIIGSCLWFVVFTLIGYYLCTRLLKVQPASDTGVFIFLFASLSNGFMGIPITMVLFDSDVLYLMILHSTVLAIYLYAAGLPLVHIGTEKNRGFSRETLLIIFKNPATICAAAAIVMLFTGLKLPSVVFDCVEMVGGFTTPLSMLIVGIQLGDSNLKRIVKNKTLLTLSVIKMAALPVLTFFMVNWLPIGVNTKVCLIFGAVFPAAVGTVAVTGAEGENALVAAEGVVLTTIISFVMIPLTATALITYYGL